jgi:hypothetical protein
MTRMDDEGLGGELKGFLDSDLGSLKNAHSATILIC